MFNNTASFNTHTIFNTTDCDIIDVADKNQKQFQAERQQTPLSATDMCFLESVSMDCCRIMDRYDAKDSLPVNMSIGSMLNILHLLHDMYLYCDDGSVKMQIQVACADLTKLCV